MTYSIIENKHIYTWHFELLLISAVMHSFITQNVINLDTKHNDAQHFVLN